MEDEVEEDEERKRRSCSSTHCLLLPAGDRLVQLC